MTVLRYGAVGELTDVGNNVMLIIENTYTRNKPYNTKISCPILVLMNSDHCDDETFEFGHSLSKTKT